MMGKLTTESVASDAGAFLAYLSTLPEVDGRAG